MPGVLGWLLWVKRLSLRRRWTGSEVSDFSRAVMDAVRIWV